MVVVNSGWSMSDTRGVWYTIYHYNMAPEGS